MLTTNVEIMIQEQQASVSYDRADRPMSEYLKQMIQVRYLWVRITGSSDSISHPFDACSSRQGVHLDELGSSSDVVSSVVEACKPGNLSHAWRAILLRTIASSGVVAVMNAIAQAHCLTCMMRPILMKCCMASTVCIANGLAP